MAKNAWLLPTLLAAVSLTGGVAGAQRDSAKATDHYPVFDIPRLSGVTVDGKEDDWKDGGFRVNSLAPVNGGLKEVQDQDARFRLAWDERGLLILATVRDDTPTEGENKNALWQKDSLEIFVGVRRGVRDWLQILVGPGTDPKTPEVRTNFDDHRESKDLRAVAPTITVARAKTSDGYTLEALVPWSNLKITPETGREIAFQMVVNDVDGDSERSQAMWYPEEGAYSNPALMHRVRLAEKPSPAQNVAILPNYDRFPRTKLLLVAPGAMAGQTVEAIQRAGRRVYGKTTLRAKAGRAVGEMTIAHPLTPPLPVVELLAGREIAGRLGLREPEGLRQNALADADFNFTPYVFSTPIFPTGDFAEPERVEQLIGPYRVETAFYDASGNPVTTAAKPGRYGALVTITSEQGQTLKRFLTLYRMAGPLEDENEISATLALPAQVGIDPKVLEAQKPAVSGMVGTLLIQAAQNNGTLAINLAGLSEMTPTDAPVWRNGPVERERRYWTALKAKTGNLVQYKYASYTPKNYEADKNAKFPLLLFLHGSGERGANLAMVRTHGPMKLVGQGKDFPFVIIAPQCPDGEWWNPAQLGLLLDELQRKFRLDPDRIYVTGLSMGGFGTWALALQFPERFAAIAPICGGGDPPDAAQLKGVPTWAFHGGKDTVVPTRLSEEMIAAQKAAGGDAKLTIYPEAGHDSWTEAYNTPELYTWLLEHRRGGH